MERTRWTRRHTLAAPLRYRPNPRHTAPGMTVSPLLAMMGYILSIAALQARRRENMKGGKILKMARHGTYFGLSVIQATNK